MWVKPSSPCVHSSPSMSRHSWFGWVHRLDKAVCWGAPCCNQSYTLAESFFLLHQNDNTLSDHWHVVFHLTRNCRQQSGTMLNKSLRKLVVPLESTSIFTFLNADCTCEWDAVISSFADWSFTNHSASMRSHSTRLPSNGIKKCCHK